MSRTGKSQQLADDSRRSVDVKFPMVITRRAARESFPASFPMAPSLSLSLVLYFRLNFPDSSVRLEDRG